MAQRSFNGFGQLARHLQGFAMRQMRHNLVAALDVIGHEIRDRAEAKVGHYQPGVGQYPAWAPLAPSTLDQKARMGWGMNRNPNTPLYATGQFHRDINYRVNNSALCVGIGTNAEHIVYTEFGTRNMPARPVFGPAAAEVLPGLMPLVAQFAGMGLGGMAVHNYSRHQGRLAAARSLMVPTGLQTPRTQYQNLLPDVY